MESNFQMKILVSVLIVIFYVIYLWLVVKFTNFVYYNFKNKDKENLEIKKKILSFQKYNNIHNNIHN